MIRYTDLVNDTICAQITPPGFGGVSIVRLSGPQSKDMLGHLIGTDKIKKVESHRAFLSQLNHPNEKRKIDEALITFFEPGKSFTGDSTVEFSLHGSPSIVKDFLDALKYLGARIAERGEFSFRAFYNGRLDLTQAEAIHSLITSETFHQSSFALENLEGAFKDDLVEIEKELIAVLTQIEAAIDFSERDIVTESTEAYSQRISEISKRIEQRKSYFQRSKNLLGKTKIVIAGPPNVGKSLLFNALISEERALVSDVPGTTRDLVREEVMVGSSLFTFTDTAGIRQTQDPIEKMGIKKGEQVTESSDLVLWVNDIENPVPELPSFLHKHDVLLVQNKIDKLSNSFERSLGNLQLKDTFIDMAWVSAKTKDGVAQLLNQISNWKNNRASSVEVFYQTSSRQHTLLLKAFEEVQLGLERSKGQAEMDLCGFHIREALDCIQNLLGRQFNDEILDSIFSGFCLGK